MMRDSSRRRNNHQAVLELLCGERREEGSAFYYDYPHSNINNNNHDERRGVGGGPDWSSRHHDHHNNTTIADGVEEVNGRTLWSPNFFVYRGGGEEFSSGVSLLPRSIHAVVVDISVLQIPNNTFYQQETLIQIAFPRTLRQIGDRAFAQCHNLTTIVIPPLLETIGRLAFSDCTSLTQVECCSSTRTLADHSSSLSLLSKLRSMQDGCFSGCRSLEYIDVPRSVSHMGKRAFYNCSKLSELDMSACDGLTKIESQSFGFCTGLKTCRLPSQVTVIGASAFGQCYELRQICIGRRRKNNNKGEDPCRLLAIGDEAFASCRSLRTMSLPSSLERIGKRAFANCFGLVTVEIAPRIALQEIGDQVFWECKRLVNIALPETIAHSELLKHGVFEGCTDLTKLFDPLPAGSTVSEVFLKEALCIRHGASPLHRLCYHQAHYSTIEKSVELLEKILEADDKLPIHLRLMNQSRWMDIFRMTPIHILVASSEANPKMLQGILDHSLRHPVSETESVAPAASILLTEDLWGRIPLHLAILSDSPITIVDMLLHAHSSTDAWNLEPCHWKSCMDAAIYSRREVLSVLIKSQFERRIDSLRSAKWRQDMIERIETIKLESVSASRCSISSVERILKQYEKRELIALLRSAVWKVKLKELAREKDDDSVIITDQDRTHCWIQSEDKVITEKDDSIIITDQDRTRCWIQSGDEVVTSHILPFLNFGWAL